MPYDERFVFGQVTQKMPKGETRVAGQNIDSFEGKWYNKQNKYIVNLFPFFILYILEKLKNKPLFFVFFCLLLEKYLIFYFSLYEASKINII